MKRATEKQRKCGKQFKTVRHSRSDCRRLHHGVAVIGSCIGIGNVYWPLIWLSTAIDPGPWHSMAAQHFQWLSLALHCWCKRKKENPLKEVIKEFEFFFLQGTYWEDWKDLVSILTRVLCFEAVVVLHRMHPMRQWFLLVAVTRIVNQLTEIYEYFI